MVTNECGQIAGVRFCKAPGYNSPCAWKYLETFQQGSAEINEIPKSLGLAGP